MTIDPSLEAVDATVDVACSVEEAFVLFTALMGTWWPLHLASYGRCGEEVFLLRQEVLAGARFDRVLVAGAW